MDSKWEISPLQKDRNMCPLDYYEITCQDHPWWIAHVRASDQSGQPCAEAIVSAINNTYGNGINPQAVPDLLKCLKEMVKYYCHEGNNSPSSIELGNKAKSIIEKSKI